MGGIVGAVVAVLLLGGGGYAYYEFVHKRKRAQVSDEREQPLLAPVGVTLTLSRALACSLRDCTHARVAVTRSHLRSVLISSCLAVIAVAQRRWYPDDRWMTTVGCH